MSNNEKWETVGSKTLSTSKMTIGQSFEGTFVELQENTTSQYEKTDKDGNILKQYNLVFLDKEGEKTLVYPSGTLNYKISDGAFEAGRRYLITRLENRKGVKASQFLVQREKDNGKLTAGAPTTNTAVPTGKAHNGAGKTA